MEEEDDLIRSRAIQACTIIIQRLLTASPAQVEACQGHLALALAALHNSEEKR